MAAELSLCQLILRPAIADRIKDGEDNFYVDDGIAEFKENTLSILTSSIFNLKDQNKSFIENSIKDAEKELNKENLEDQKRYLFNQKIDILKSIN